MVLIVCGYFSLTLRSILRCPSMSQCCVTQPEHSFQSLLTSPLHKKYIYHATCWTMRSGMVMYTYILSTRENKAGGSQVWGQPGLHSNTLSR
jgi:hypothetical protein